MQAGGTTILSTLKAVVEMVRPPLRTRMMYAMFGVLEFVLPAKTKSGHWPMR